MRKLPHALVLLITITLFLLLTALFVFLYIAVGWELDLGNSSSLTVYRLLSQIDFDLFRQVFLLTFVYMLILDLLVVWMRSSWKQIAEKSGKVQNGLLKRYWYNHRIVHLTFFLATVFIALSLAAPMQLMSVFTAIVSISILVNNLVKKVEKSENEKE